MRGAAGTQCPDDDGRARLAALPDAGYFDRWYADIADSTSRDAIVARMLQLPAYLRSTSLSTWQGVADVEEALRVPHDGLLLDIGCGRAGYGIEIAHRTGARLVGVDFSGHGAAAGGGRGGGAAAGRAGRVPGRHPAGHGPAGRRGGRGDVRGRGAVR
ncbi:hypothetical protein OG912_00015 [Streptomyces sp. NBC_00464]|uniref:class I SAM-dependent methyltransferase n=1 Tax=Streptomyces sp. NBC_00464 TaxID=2975751 RepID=UPI002E17A128